jgi:hypothetical protein
MAITDEVLNELLKDYQKPEDLLGKDGIFKQLQKRLLEKAMGAELTVHLGYDKHDPAGRNSGNSRNGTSPKTLKGEFGHLELATPRDRNGTFEPLIVAKGQRRFEGFDQAILSLYSRGMTTREIEGHLLDIYGVEVSPQALAQPARQNPQVAEILCFESGSRWRQELELQRATRSIIHQPMRGVFRVASRYALGVTPMALRKARAKALWS